MRAPTELSEERSAISQEYCDTTSNVHKQDAPADLDGSSLQPPRESTLDNQTDEDEHSPEMIFIHQRLLVLKIYHIISYNNFDVSRKN